MTKTVNDKKQVNESATLINIIPKIGLWSWSFVGFVVACILISIGLATVSEIVIPMTFAVVLAIVFKPLATILVRNKFKPSLAAGLVVIGLLLVAVVVVTATVRGVSGQLSEISETTNTATQTAAEQTEELGIDQASIEEAKVAIEEAKPMIATGLLSGVVSGISTFVAISSGIILGSLIMYYFLKDGTGLRRSLVKKVDDRYQIAFDEFIGDSCRILRDYGRGRTVMSIIVSLFIGLVAFLMGLPFIFTIMIVNFIGGYIPYIGAFLGGGLAVVIALGEGGLTMAVIMLIAVLASNLILENFIEPKIMGQTLDIHPVVVLVVTALGGLIAGIVGLILAVPTYVIIGSAISRLYSQGVVKRVKKQVKPAMKQILD
jgi:predicted PurR-regulated permease PerM